MDTNLNLAMWLQQKGFSADIQDAFEGSLLDCTVNEYMDGEATVSVFATCSGPDCLKEAVSKLGSRLKVYNAIKVAINEGYQQKVHLHFGYIPG